MQEGSIYSKNPVESFDCFSTLEKFDEVLKFSEVSNSDPMREHNIAFAIGHFA